MKWSFFVYGLIALTVPCATIASTALSLHANEPTPPLLRVDSAFVWVPVLVKTEAAETLGHIDVSRLRLFDNGTPETMTAINTDGLPISLVILMQTGGSASRILGTYTDLPVTLAHMLGNSVHEITLVTFDSHVEEIWHFPDQTDGVNYALTHQHAGDKGAAIKDAFAFGVRQLQGEPGRYRRVILLLSQGTDVGSSTFSQSLLERLGSSSAVVYSLTFPGEKERTAQPHQKRHGASMDETLERSNRMLDNKTAEEIARLSGGTEFRFHDQSGFNAAMLETLSDFQNGITVGFQPSRHEAGFHHIEVMVDSPKLRVTARTAYWSQPPE